MTFDLTTYIAIPLLIFLARVIDVTLGTMRLIFVSKGLKKIAPIIGFFEILIYIITINQLISNLTSIWLYIIYALGFAAGNYVGIYLEEKMSIGKVMIRIITQREANQLIQNLRNANYTITTLNAKGKNRNVKIIFMVINKKALKKVIQIIKKTNPKAFYTVEDVRHAQGNSLLTQTLLKNPKALFNKK